MTDDLKQIAARADAAELNVYARLPIHFVRGRGSWLFAADGTRYLDMYGGHAVASTGHCHPRVVEAIQKQALELLFYSNSIHFVPRIEASEMLLRHAPHADSRVFYVSTGCEANEVALKIARKVTGRRKIVTFHGAFHGRTLATLSAGGVEKYRKTAEPCLIGPPDFVHVPFDDPAAAIAAIDGQQRAKVRLYVTQTAKVTVVLLAFMSAVGSCCAREIQMLLFPSAYASVASELRLMVWGFSGYSLAVTVAWILNSAKRPRLAVTLVAVPLVVVVAGAQLLVPSQFTGGAAWAVAAAGLAAAIAALLALRTSFGAQLSLAQLLRIGVCVALVELLAWLWPVTSTAGLVGKLAIVAKLVVLAIAFVVAALGTRVISVAELRGLRSGR